MRWVAADYRKEAKKLIGKARKKAVIEKIAKIMLDIERLEQQVQDLENEKTPLYDIDLDYVEQYKV